MAVKKGGKTNKTAHVLNVLAGAKTSQGEESENAAPSESLAQKQAARAPVVEVSNPNDEALSQAILESLTEDIEGTGEEIGDHQREMENTAPPETAAAAPEAMQPSAAPAAAPPEAAAAAPEAMQPSAAPAAAPPETAAAAPEAMQPSAAPAAAPPEAAAAAPEAMQPSAAPAAAPPETAAAAPEAMQPSAAPAAAQPETAAAAPEAMQPSAAPAAAQPASTGGRLPEVAGSLKSVQSSEIPVFLTLDSDATIGYVNVMQALVEEKVPKYLKMFELCTCDRCTADVKALTLTNLPAKYAVMEKGNVIPMLTVYEGRYNQTLIAQILKACDVVMKNPRH